MYAVFDYVFFRVYDFYKRKNSDIPIDRAIQMLSIIQGTLLMGIIMIVDFFETVINREVANKYIIGVPVAIAILIINEIRYKRMAKKNQFALFYERWENEDKILRKNKGIVIVLLPVFLLFGIPILLWFIKQMQ
jgi:hypothetical protein